MRLTLHRWYKTTPFHHEPVFVPCPHQLQTFGSDYKRAQMHASKIVVLAAYFLTALLAVMAVKGSYAQDKKTAQDRQFLMSMRYGRSRETERVNPKHLQVAPRSDVFYLGSRYGKRSSDPPSPPLVYPIPQLCGNDDDLSCDYTGVSNLYRCVQSFRKESSSEDLSPSSM